MERPQLPNAIAKKNLKAPIAAFTLVAMALIGVAFGI
jgi:hypothetical protein